MVPSLDPAPPCIISIISVNRALCSMSIISIVWVGSQPRIMSISWPSPDPPLHQHHFSGVPILVRDTLRIMSISWPLVPSLDLDPACIITHHEHQLALPRPTLASASFQWGANPCQRPSSHHQHQLALVPSLDLDPACIIGIISINRPPRIMSISWPPRPTLTTASFQWGANSCQRHTAHHEHQLAFGAKSRPAPTVHRQQHQHHLGRDSSVRTTGSPPVCFFWILPQPPADYRLGYCSP